MTTVAGELMEAEADSQPALWEATLREADTSYLPERGARVAVVGCGTSFNIAMAWAELRERSGHGITDAWPASEARLRRGYDLVLAISRSGTTTEVIQLLEQNQLPSVAVVAVENSPVAKQADDAIVLADADEQSVVQTRFATTTLALLRAHIGQDLGPVIDQARDVVDRSDDELFGRLVSAEQVTFLGVGWAYGLAVEAGLKLRESAQFWTEAYHAMEYRHGPISIASPGRAVWAMGEMPDKLLDDVAATGATVVESERDPMAELVVVHRYALHAARMRGLDPDRPRSLSRSVILR